MSIEPDLARRGRASGRPVVARMRRYAVYPFIPSIAAGRLERRVALVLALRACCPQ